MSAAAPLTVIDRAELTSLLRQALARETVEVCDYTIHPITYDATNPVSGGVYRVVGTATFSFPLGTSPVPSTPP